MIIIEARPDQAAILSDIAQAAKKHWGYPDEWLACWRDALTVAPDFIRDHRVAVAVENDEILGFYGLIRGEKVWTLEHLWVRPEKMGGKIGARLLAHAVETARRSGADILEIESDPNAEGFYLRQGARRVGEITGSVLGQTRVLPKLEIKL